MNVQAKSPLPLAEQERRRKIAAATNWSAEMEGLGKQRPEFAALTEEWVTGQVSDEEHIRRVKATLKQVLAKRGH